MVLTSQTFPACSHDLRAIHRPGKKQKLAYLAFLSERLPGNVHISHPQGGMVLWLQAPGLNLSPSAAFLEQNRIAIRSRQLFSPLSLHNHFACASPLGLN